MIFLPKWYCKMPKTKEFSEKERLEIIERHAQGQSMREIAKLFKTSHRSIGYIIKKKDKFGTIKNLPGRGRKMATSDRTNRQILREVERKGKITVKEIKESLNLDCSPTTIRRRLHDGGYWGRIAKRTACLTKKHIAARLKFAKDYIDKDEDFWTRVIWSDESKFELFGSKRRQTVWRKNGTTNKLGFTQATVMHSKYVMVWGCFSARGLGRLVEISGKMDSKMYTEIIEENLLPSATEMGLLNDFIFQQDNDPKHTSRFFKAFLQKKQIAKLPWPSQSPDLNPIENLWDELARRIPQIKRRSFAEFKNTLFGMWKEIGQEVLMKLSRSMSKRLKLVIEAKGGPINY